MSFYYLLDVSMDLAISYHQFCLIVPVALLAMVFPASINEIGIREGVFVIILGTFGVDEARAAAFAWFEWALVLSYGLLGGIVFLIRKQGCVALKTQDTLSSRDKCSQSSNAFLRVWQTVAFAV